MKPTPAMVKRLEALARQHGGTLTPAEVVADAQNPRSPLHEAFPWDDAQAAHEHRLQIARMLIRSVRIERMVNERMVTSVRFVRDPDRVADRSAGYVDVLRLRSDRGRALESLHSEMTAVMTRVERAVDLALMLGLEAEMLALRQQVEQVLARLGGMKRSA